MKNLSIIGGATVYAPTGQKCADGSNYGDGIAIAPVLLEYFPYGSLVHITNINNKLTITTVVHDTGNFGVSKKYPTIDAPNGTVFRIIDLPSNIAHILGIPIEGCADVEITKL